MNLLRRAARTKRIRNTEAQKTKEKKARATKKKMNGNPPLGPRQTSNFTLAELNVN